MNLFAQQRLIFRSLLTFAVSKTNSNFQVIKSKKEIYHTNKAKGIIPLTIEELTRQNDDSGLANDGKTLADTVFKGYRDDLDYNDENDVGQYNSFFLGNITFKFGMSHYAPNVLISSLP